MKKAGKRIIMIVGIMIGLGILFLVTNVMITNYKMKQMTLEERLEYVYDKYEKKSKSGGMTFQIEDEKDFSWSKESGKMVNEQSYPLASITKMYTTTVIFALADEGKLSLEDPISKYLSEEVTNGIHVYKGTDYGKQITISQLLSQTSGLPDYYTENGKEFKALGASFSKDQGINFDEILVRTRGLNPHFAPGTKNKAFYSNLNFDLLGKIIEQITGESLENNYETYIFTKLKVTDTYLFQKGMEFSFPGVWYKGEIYKVPNILATVGASGGMVSTRSDNMKFLKAFFGGELFDSADLKVMEKTYRKLQFFPMQYGTGIMRFSMFGSPELIGHSGSTGTLCYYSPKYHVYVTGTINECKEAKAIQIAAELVGCFAYE